MAGLLEHSDTFLREQVVRCLGAFRARLGPLLGETLDGLLASLGSGDGQEVLRDFTRIAQPVVHLPLWVGEAAALPGREPSASVLGAAVESAVMGYLCAQAQDAIIDGAGAVPERLMLLAHSLFCRHQAVLVPLVAAHAGFWGMFEEKWLGYGEALAFERRVQRQPGGADAVAFEHILRRSHPLVIPGAAVLAHLERWELFPELERFVRHSTAAAQLLDDLVDAEQDRRDGNHTWVVNRLGGGEGPASLGRRLYLEGGYDTLMDEALGELALAQEVARGLRMAAAVLALERDAGQMRSMREQVAGALTRWFFEE